MGLYEGKKVILIKVNMCIKIHIRSITYVNYISETFVCI